RNLFCLLRRSLVSPHRLSTATHTLSLHDALPICPREVARRGEQASTHATHRSRPPAGGLFVAPRGTRQGRLRLTAPRAAEAGSRDRKSTRLNSSHVKISYAVFCLKKKKE